jgi:ribosome-associated protein
MIRLARSNPLNPNIAPIAPEEPTFEAESFSESSEASLSGDIAKEMILTRLDDDKAQDVVVIDLKDKSSIADCMIVASGRSQRHVGALADNLLRALKDAGAGKARVEGMPHCDWVLIDVGDVIVHLFRPEVRSFYNLEKIWSVDPPPRGGDAIHRA